LANLGKFGENGMKYEEDEGEKGREGEWENRRKLKADS
jgi:hypothetical protein